jgi:ABC-type transport system substrate-binding protein
MEWWYVYTGNWNGWDQAGVTFASAAGVGINDKGADVLNTGFTTPSDWILADDFSFEVTGSAGASNIINTVVTMSIESFHSMGIKAESSFITFSTLLANLASGDFNAVFYATSNLAPNPTYLQSYVSDAVTNVQATRWGNQTFDDLYDTIETSTNYNEVLEASYEAQRILWQEQPRVVMYNNELTTMYRRDRFEGAVTVPGTGGFGYFSLVKMHLKDDFRGLDQYPDWPLGGTLYYGLPQPMGSQNTIWDNNAYTIIVMGMIEEGLAIRNPEDLTWQAFTTVSDWEQVSDYSEPAIGVTEGTKLVWTLQDDIYWHDGEPLTVDDLIYSYKLLTPFNFTASGVKDSDEFMDNDGFQQFLVSPLFADPLKDIVAVRKINDTSMEVISNKSGLFEFANLQITLYAEHIWSQINDPLNAVNSNPIGSGPYKWLSRQPGEFVILERNQDYKFAPEKAPDIVTTETTSDSNNTTTGEDTPSAPGFELLIALFSIGTVTIVAKRRK